MNIGFKKDIKNVQGASTLEFAIIAPVFFFIILGILDFGRVAFLEFVLQSAAREGARYAATNRRMPDDPSTPGVNESAHVFGIEQRIFRRAAPILRSNDIDVFINVSTVTDPTNPAIIDNGGGPAELMTIIVQHEVRLVTPIIGQFFQHNGVSGRHLIRVRVVYRNEPWPL